MDISGLRPIETVGNSQKSGMSHGCGYEERPPPGFSSRRKFSTFCTERRPSRKARAEMPGEAGAWKYTGCPSKRGARPPDGRMKPPSYSRAALERGGM